MTINEYINECQNYEYSQEYYDILKECAQLELLERYLTNQEFIQENAERIDSTKEYFQEATTEDNIYMVEEQVVQAQTGVFTKVMTSIGNIIDKQVNSLQSFAGRIKTNLTDGMEARKLMKPFKGLDAKQKIAVGKELGKILTSFNSIKFARHNDKPIIWEIHKFIPDIFQGNKMEELNGVPANLVKMFNELDFNNFSVSVTIPANAPIFGDSNDIDGLKSDLKDAKDSVNDNRDIPSFDDSTCHKLIQDASHDQDITIELNETALNDYIKSCKELSKMAKKLASTTKSKANKLFRTNENGEPLKEVGIKRVVEFFRSKKSKEKRRAKSVALMGIHNKILIINTASGNTISAYKELIKYLETVVKVQKNIAAIMNVTGEKK